MLSGVEQNYFITSEPSHLNWNFDSTSDLILSALSSRLTVFTRSDSMWLTYCWHGENDRIASLQLEMGFLVKSAILQTGTDTKSWLNVGWVFFVIHMKYQNNL